MMRLNLQSQGYIDVSDTYNSHYFAWFSESRNAPSTDPLIVWFSGGPGCSSSLAMLTENGPCLARNDGSGTDFNPYGWNNKANLMFVGEWSQPWHEHMDTDGVTNMFESSVVSFFCFDDCLLADQPAGVGFSYSDSGGYSHNETQVALYMTVFFARFYEAYPEYAKNDLFIAAESYGGHYGPSIAYGLFEANKKGASFPLKGFAIGNGLVDPLHQYPTYPDFVEKECPAETGKECVPKAGIESMRAAVPQCTKLIQECQDDISDCGEAQSFCNNAMFGPYEQTGLNPYDIRIPCAVPPLCYDFSGVSTLLNNAATQKAIGVSNINWQSCNFEVNSQFSKSVVALHGPRCVCVLEPVIFCARSFFCSVSLLFSLLPQ